MLPATHRLADPASFRHAVRRGRRSGSRTLVIHLATVDEVGSARVGLVVSRAVGNAVVRNRVKRRLRHLLRAHLDDLADSSVLVVRAQPVAATASAAELGSDLTRCLGRVHDRSAQ